MARAQVKSVNELERGKIIPKDQMLKPKKAAAALILEQGDNDWIVRQDEGLDDVISDYFGEVSDKTSDYIDFILQANQIGLAAEDELAEDESYSPSEYIEAMQANDTKLDA